MKITITDIIVFILALLAVIGVASIIFNQMEDMFVECDEYENIPYRYEGSFFGTDKVKTIEGNHDGYMKVCNKGTTIKDALAVTDEKEKKDE